MSSSSIRPKLVAFDLDGTVWTPDMYQLWGGGAPFSVVDAQKQLSDRGGNPVRLLGAIGSILHSLRFEEEWKDTKVAWVSCTDEPEWAKECLNKFKSTPTKASSCQIPTTLNRLCHSSEIYKANKQVHMRALQKQYPEIAFEDMVFFDNEKHNTDSVSKLGVMSVHCPRGMEVQVWDDALGRFAQSRK
jgi:magnesium-dependent phosphatase 1